MPERNLLLVEGRDDEFVFKHLLGTTGRTGIWEIKESGSIDELLEDMSVAPKTSERHSVAFVADADFDPSARWRAIRGALVKAGYNTVPTSLPGSGLVLPSEGALAKAGVWMMPDNSVSGMLEDFLGLLIPPGDHLWDLSADLTTYLLAERPRFIVKHRAKAQIHSWLAWQETPGRPFGQAITAKYLDSNAAAAAAVLTWLDQLASP